MGLNVKINKYCLECLLCSTNFENYLDYKEHHKKCHFGKNTKFYYRKKDKNDLSIRSVSSNKF